MNRITLITLGVKDLARARAFYARLGWREEDGTEGVAFYDLGGMKFGLYTLAKHAEDLGCAPESLGTGASALSVNFRTEAEVDAAYAQALEAGAVEKTKPHKVFWGGYSGLWADPDGHIWEYAMNPYWTLDEAGKIAQT